IALTEGSVQRNAMLDQGLTGELTALDGVEFLDVVGLHDGDNADIAWGTELRAAQFDNYSGALGGASRIPDGSDTWVPNAYNGAGLDHNDAAAEPRGAFEAWNTPGAANAEFTPGNDNEPEPEPTDPT